MPWPWPVTTACIDLATGQILNWPLPTSDFPRNQLFLDAAYEVWRVLNLYRKPKTRRGAKGKLETNWTPHDIDFFAWLQENAWKPEFGDAD